MRYLGKMRKKKRNIAGDERTRDSLTACGQKQEKNKELKKAKIQKYRRYEKEK